MEDMDFHLVFLLKGIGKGCAQGQIAFPDFRGNGPAILIGRFRYFRIGNFHHVTASGAKVFPNAGCHPVDAIPVGHLQSDDAAQVIRVGSLLESQPAVLNTDLTGKIMTQNDPYVGSGSKVGTGPQVTAQVQAGRYLLRIRRQFRSVVDDCLSIVETAGIADPLDIRYELEKAYWMATSGRPGSARLTPMAAAIEKPMPPLALPKKALRSR